MPWTTGDVDRHKKGLTQEQKRKWVSVANRVRRECLDSGSSESTCDARAVRIANGSVGNTNNMETIIQINTSYDVREENFLGRRHLVVPVIMMVEGVHNGSHGPLYHPAEELGRNASQWNGMPITINHPQRGGISVSAHEEGILESEQVGSIYNCHMDGTKLRGEAWIEEQRLLAKSPSVHQRLRNGEVLEVSIGVFNDQERTPGTWHGERYIAVARNHRADHVALLPDARGACSVDDGCGIRLNEEKGGNGEMNKSDDNVKQLLSQGYTITPVTNRTGYKEMVMDIQRKLDRMDTDSRVHYLEEVFEDKFVYRVNVRDGDMTYYERPYQLMEDGSVEITGEPQEVHKSVDYITMEEGKKQNFFQKLTGGKTMSKNKAQDPCCPEKVEQLISNEATQWTADDKEWLLQQDEATLNKMFPNKQEEPPKKKEEPTTPTKNEEGEKKEEKREISQEELKAALKETAKDIDSYLEMAPSEISDYIREGVRLNKDKRASMIKEINENSEFSKEELADWSTARLEKLHKSVVHEPTDYSGMGGGYRPPEPTGNEEGKDDGPPPLYPAGTVNTNKKEGKEE